jgi:hypothetical protein
MSPFSAGLFCMVCLFTFHQAVFVGYSFSCTMIGILFSLLFTEVSGRKTFNAPERVKKIYDDVSSTGIKLVNP